MSTHLACETTHRQIRFGECPWCKLARARLKSAAIMLDGELLVCFPPCGPNTALAKELLEHGEKACVLDYFRECAAHWERGGAFLARWIKLIEEGGIPNFGALPSMFGI
jgi:hypothetical protein